MNDILQGMSDFESKRKLIQFSNSLWEVIDHLRDQEEERTGVAGYLERLLWRRKDFREAAKELDLEIPQRRADERGHHAKNRWGWEEEEES